MPHYWFVIGTPDEILELLEQGRWAEARQKIYEYLRDDGLGLDKVFFDPREHRAHILAHSPESVDTSRLGKTLGEEPVEVFTVEELGDYDGQGPASAA